ncbi:MAG: zf-HC2 domain-containing protein [Acidimicrobiia bacterium]
MSGCENAVEYVYQYIDGELTVSRKARIRWHLRRCNHCDDAFEFEQELKARIAAAGKQQPSEEFLAALRAIIEEEKQC